MISDKLANNFIAEIMAYALNNKMTFDVVKAYLKLAYLQDESQKKLWQWICRNYDKTGRIATIGQIQQQFVTSEGVLELIADIQDVELDDTADGNNNIISTFEEYLKQMMFLDSNDKIADTYNRGDKDAAYKLFTEMADKMSKFSITDANVERVFEDFDTRMAHRKSEDYSKYFKIPTCIDEIDYALGGRDGGPETGEYVLWLGISGAGKSQLLVHLGISAARQNRRVVHFQLEGTKQQCLNRYDASWTGTLYSDMKVGEVTAKKLEVTKKIVKKLKKTDIFVFSCEEWGGMSLNDVRKNLKDVEKKYGKIDVIIIDYLELLEVGDGISYKPNEERFRQQKLSKAMKTLAMEFNAVVHTATQSNGISLEEQNDPDFVLSRSNLNEDKGKIRPADLFVTLNFTLDEKKDQTMRLYIDKAREHAGGDIIHICTNFAYSRFYDRKRTQDMDWDEYEDISNEDEK
jgi:replicative DNA helicase